MARPDLVGAISFGLVSVPVRMFTATESKELTFHFLDRRDMAPIGYDKVNKDDRRARRPGRHRPRLRGREGPLRRGDRRGRRPPRRRADALDRHLRLRLDRRDRPDLLPQGATTCCRRTAPRSPTACSSGRSTETGRVAIAKVVIRNKQHLACVRAGRATRSCSRRCTTPTRCGCPRRRRSRACSRPRWRWRRR